MVHSWHLSAMNGPVAKFNNFFFSGTVVVLEVWFPNREQSKIFQAMLVLCLLATRSLIFVRNTKLVHRRQPYPTLSIVHCYRM